MCDHLEKQGPTSPPKSNDQEGPKKAQKTVSAEYITAHIKMLPKNTYDYIVTILGETVFEFQKVGVLAKLEESAKDILNSKKGAAK